MSFEDLVNYCEKIDEKGWANDLRSIDSDSTIEDFNDLECNLIDNNLMDYHGALKQKINEQELTEYKVEILVAKRGSAYVMAKEHEDAVVQIDKLIENGYDEDPDIQWTDFDDEYRVDGDDQ